MRRNSCLCSPPLGTTLLAMSATHRDMTCAALPYSGAGGVGGAPRVGARGGGALPAALAWLSSCVSRDNSFTRCGRYRSTTLRCRSASAETHVKTHATLVSGVCALGVAAAPAPAPATAPATCFAQSSSSRCCKSLVSGGGMPRSPGGAPGAGSGYIARARALASASCVSCDLLLKQGSSICASCGALPDTNLSASASRATLNTASPVRSVFVASPPAAAVEASNFSMNANLMFAVGHVFRASRNSESDRACSASIAFSLLSPVRKDMRTKKLTIISRIPGVGAKSSASGAIGTSPDPLGPSSSLSMSMSSASPIATSLSFSSLAVGMMLLFLSSSSSSSSSVSAPLRGRRRFGGSFCFSSFFSTE
mmetsp:Transcript_3241/g.12129  ORF Transcript_3241/g.12129 Transcript_3241/m.12129 type:complete len:366 (-) Transcript_3241:5200-6297(-)